MQLSGGIGIPARAGGIWLTGGGILQTHERYVKPPERSRLNRLRKPEYERREAAERGARACFSTSDSPALLALLGTVLALMLLTTGCAS